VARYRYAGGGPQEDGDGGIVRPGDERDFEGEPLWGPWVLIDEDGGAVSDSAPPVTAPPAPAPASPAPASPAPPASLPADTGSTGKGI
jgi:hypothetical protein